MSQEEKSKIEIPFGAKDSELCGWEYIIPEGMEAEIKGGKIIVRKKEIEDKKNYIQGIRKTLASIEDKAHNILGLYDYDWVAIRASHRLLGEYLDCLENQKEQNHTKWSEEDENYLEEIISNLKYAAKNRKSCSSRIAEECIHWLKIRLKSLGPQPKVEWSEEDETIIDTAVYWLERKLEVDKARDISTRACPLSMKETIKRLKSLRPQSKEEREPMEIKYGGKIYQVHGMRALPGGATGYIIEDEPGHYDCIMNPEEVLGGGYGVKQNGSPYPTKGATFDESHWKPSEEQMEALLELEETYVLEHERTQETAHLYMIIKSLKEQLLKLRRGEL